MALSAVAQPQPKTLKMEMEYLHQEYGVNFVYDSSLDLSKPYSGKPMNELLKGRRTDGRTSSSKTVMPAGNSSVMPDPDHSVMPDPDRASLELCLQTLFAGTGIDYEIMKKYIVLTTILSRI